MIIDTIEIPDYFVSQNLSDRTKAELLLKWTIKERIENKPESKKYIEVYTEIQNEFASNGHTVSCEHIRNIRYLLK